MPTAASYSILHGTSTGVNAPCYAGDVDSLVKKEYIAHACDVLTMRNLCSFMFMLVQAAKKKSLPCLPFHFARYLHREPCPAAYTKRSPRQYTVLGISESGQNHLFVHCEILNFTLLLSPAVFSVKATAVLRSRVRAPWGGANSAQATAEAGKSQCIARLRWREMLAAF